MAHTTLKISSMTSSESTLFQERTKKWLEEALETNIKRSVTSTFVPAPKFNNETDTETDDNLNSVDLEEFKPKVTVTEFQTEILAENSKRPFPRQLPILKIRVKSEV